MSYNQKVWLGVLTVCTLFWLALISGIYAYDNSRDHKRAPGRQEQAMNTLPAKPPHSGTGAVNALP